MVHATNRTASARIVKITPNFQLTSSARVRISSGVWTAAPRPRLNFGYSRSRFPASAAISLRASESVVERLRRPRTTSSRSSRSSKKDLAGLVAKIRAIASGT